MGSRAKKTLSLPFRLLKGIKNSEKRTKILLVLILVIIGQSLYIIYEPEIPEQLELVQTSQKIQAIFTVSDLSDAYSELTSNLVDTKDSVIILLLDSGGGSVNDLTRIVDFIHRKQLDNCTFIAYAYTALSAGYLVGIYCDHFYTSPTALIGGLGVVSMWAVYNDSADSSWVYYYIKKAPYKLTTEEFTDEQRKMMEEVVASADEYFCKQIAIIRHLDQEFVKDKIMTGYIWIGTKAFELGLVDGVTSYTWVLRQYGIVT